MSFYITFFDIFIVRRYLEQNFNPFFFVGIQISYCIAKSNPKIARQMTNLQGPTIIKIIREIRFKKKSQGCHRLPSLKKYPN
jgi:hypothetical protein